MTIENGFLLHNRYRIIGVLGKGGMGAIYHAMDESLGVEVAVKENLFTTNEYANQFRLEAAILAKLRHPNLPRVSDYFVINEQGQYLVMDYIEGEDLRQRMEREGTISEEEAILIGAAICDALAYLHGRKPPILHRDIKPGNIKITPDGHVFLVDFGLAKEMKDSQLTATGARAMTPGYSPPEQYGTARTDTRTDIYSLAATLYAALTGIVPEDGLARMVDNIELTPMRKRNPVLSPRLAQVIEKALATKAENRFQSAIEFKQFLLYSNANTQDIEGGFMVAPPPEGGEKDLIRNDPERPITAQLVENTDSQSAFRRFHLGNRIWIASSILLGLVVIILLAMLLGQPDGIGIFKKATSTTTSSPTTTHTPHKFLVATKTRATTPTETPTEGPTPTETRIYLPSRLPTPTRTSTKVPPPPPTPVPPTPTPIPPTPTPTPTATQGGLFP